MRVERPMVRDVRPKRVVMRAGRVGIFVGVGFGRCAGGERVRIRLK